MDSTFSEPFRRIFRLNGLDRLAVGPAVARFRHLTVLLTEANARFNLTAIRDLPGIIARHYADSLLAEPLFPRRARVLDIGCGGGFPCLPLALARPDLRITALDSTQKKLDFVQHAAEALELKHFRTICARAESRTLRELYGEFDVVTGRAVARLNILAELAMPFLHTGGLLIAYKGAQGSEELAEAAHALQVLGGGEAQDLPMRLVLPPECQTAPAKVPAAAQAGEIPAKAPATGEGRAATAENSAAQEGTEAPGSAEATESRHILVIPKERPTPPQYPRAYAAILKQPL